MIDRIVGLDAWHVPIGLRRGHTMSFGTIAHADLVVVRATASAGHVGWGEVTILGGPYWSEESAESVMAALGTYVFPRMMGAGVHGAAAALAESSVRGNPFALCAIGIALDDLRARALDLPLGALWGTYRPMPIPLSWSLAAATAEADLVEAGERRDLGYEIFKVKVGAQPLRDDLARLEKLRVALGPDISIRVDANQGWSRATAGAALPALNELEVAFIEQPLPAADTAGLAALQAASSAPIAADESLRTVADAGHLAAIDASRVFVYKLSKHGGIEAARTVAAVARAANVEGYLGCMIESSIGTAANLAFAASHVELPYGCELFGPQLLVDDLVEQPVEYLAGHIKPPSGAGLGVTVAADKVERLSIAHRSCVDTN